MTGTSEIQRDDTAQRLGALALQQASIKTMASGESIMALLEPQSIKLKLPSWVQAPFHPNPTDPAAPALGYPDQLGPFNSGAITFNHGVPVGGWMSLTLYKNGNYIFSGHFHDSGAPSYDIDGVWVIVSRSGTAFTFAAKGTTHGTFESGSRNFDFNVSGNKPEIQNAWTDLCAGYHWRWTANVNWNLKDAVDSVVNALKVAGTVVAAVVSVVALV